MTDLGTGPDGDSSEYSTRNLTQVILRLRYVLAAGMRTVMPTAILPVAQADILQRLASSGSTRISDLASRSRLAVNTVSTLISQLEEGGLVSREKDATDRRVVLIAVTAKGRRRLDEWLAMTEELLGSAIDHLSAGSQRQLRDSMPVLLELADAIETAYDVLQTDRTSRGLGEI